MESTVKKTPNRWFLLVLGFLSTLTMGVVYAWSILKVPLTEEFGWTTSQLALSYSIMMSLFCIGLLVGGLLLRALPTRAVILLGGTMAAAGFILTSMNPGSYPMLLLSLPLLTGTGIGIAYNTILSAVNMWFPDRKGLSTGTQMMGFGLSALVVGNIAALMFDMAGFGWRRTYLMIGIAIAVVVYTAAVFVRFPTGDELTPYLTGSKKQLVRVDDVEPKQMVKSMAFILYFLYIVAVTGIGQAVFSFAKDLSLFVGAPVVLANLLVGIVSVSNGLGRVLFGLIFDRIGLRKTLLIAILITLGATISTLITVKVFSIPLLVLGLILTGLSFSSGPTLSSTFVSSQFGIKYFPVNFSVVNLSGVLSSLSATLLGNLYASTGSFEVPYMVLTGLAVFAFVIYLLLQGKLHS